MMIQHTIVHSSSNLHAQRLAVEEGAGKFHVLGRREKIRGRFTCYHEVGAPHRTATVKDGNEVEEAIKKFYVEAARRLPLVQIPELIECIRTGGHCIGLADPVSNIILNAISRLPSSSDHPSPPSPSDHPSPLERSHGDGATNCDSNWMFVAAQSHFGLLVFMVAYFRYLTDAQARCYLDLADYDLSVAIKLVHHDRFTDTSRLCLLPDGGKIKAALKIAALKAGHPVPDDLAGIMTTQYPSDLLIPVITNLRGDKVLSSKDVWEIKSLLSNQWPPTSPFSLEFLCRPNGNTCIQGTDNGVLIHASGHIGGGLFARVSVDRGDQTSSRPMEYISNPHMKAKLSKCLLENTQIGCHEPGLTVNFDAVPCNYIMSLKMCLLDTIHAFYIKAFAILPSGEWGPSFLRALLVAGHCYGPFDPVSNIILNSIWYSIKFPPLKVPTLDLIEPHDGILDTSSMSRLESRSLNGLIAMVRATRTDPCSEHEALEYLCYWNCNPSEMCRVFNFYAVAKAAKHPQYAAFGAFMSMSISMSMYRHLRFNLQAQAGGRISKHNLARVKGVIKVLAAVTPVKDQNYKDSFCLLQEAELEISRIKLAARDKLTFVRTELNRMLLKYCIQHPWVKISLPRSPSFLFSSDLFCCIIAVFVTFLFQD